MGAIGAPAALAHLQQVITNKQKCFSYSGAATDCEIFAFVFFAAQ
jgi:hypothetical protein